MTAAAVKPKRIQLRRVKGWRMPPNTVKVDRATKWGNRYTAPLADCGCRSWDECDHNRWRCEDAAQAVESFRCWLETSHVGLQLAEDARRELRGKNLACWCKAGEPCHADVLLEIANK